MQEGTAERVQPEQTPVEDPSREQLRARLGETLPAGWCLEQLIDIGGMAGVVDPAGQGGAGVDDAAIVHRGTGLAATGIDSTGLGHFQFCPPDRWCAGREPVRPLHTIFQ